MSNLYCSAVSIIEQGGVYSVWRMASPLGRTSPSKRARFHLAFTWEKSALLPGLARLAESPPRANYIYFPTKPGIQYLRTSCFFLYL